MSYAIEYAKQLQRNLGLENNVAWPNFIGQCEKDGKVISFAALYILAGSITYNRAIQEECTRCTKEFQSGNLSLDCMFEGDRLIRDEELRRDNELYKIYDDFTS